MAAFTSQRTGNWSDTSTSSPWYVSGGTPCAIPGNGDTATVATGHTVTVDVDTTVGSSPADRTTMVLTVNGPTGKVIIAASKTLTVNGNCYFNAGASGNIQNGLEMNAGSILTIGSNAVTNGWVIQGGRYNKHYVRGSSGSHASVRAAAANFGACTQQDNNNGTGWDAQYCDFSSLGNSSTPGVRCSPAISTSSGVPSSTFDYCTFDSFGGQFYSPNTAGTATSATGFVITNCQFTNWASISNAIQLYGNSGGGTWTFSGNVIDRTADLLFSNPQGYSVTGNYIGKSINGQPASGSNWPDKRFTAFSNNFIRLNSGNVHVDSSQDSNYWLTDTDSSNITTFYTKALGGNNTIQNGVIDYTCNVSSGSDHISAYSDGLTATITGAANNGSGLIRITTSAAHNYGTGDKIVIAQVGGTTEANNASSANPYWTITSVDATHFDLQSSTFTNAWTSGGYSFRAFTSLAVTGAANNGSGLIRITTATHTFSTGDSVTISGVTGTTEANGSWTITVISTTTFDLVGSTFANAYVSGGTVLRQATSTTIKGFVVTPSAYGAVVGKFISQWGTNPFGNLSIEHNTFVTALPSADPSSPEAGIGLGESAAGGPLEVASVKSNLAWTPKQSSPPAGQAADANAYPGPLLLRWQSLIQDYAAASNCDYNWGYNLATENSLYGYFRALSYRTNSMFSSGTPDSHGANGNATFQGDPQFVDATRTFAKWDTASTGLANSYSSWVTSTSYSVGDFVQVATSGVYYGATIGFRCIAAHTSGASTKPCVGASWRTNWEFSGLYRLRQDLTLIPTVYAWVRNGYKVQNSSMNGAGHDGVTPGAMGYQGGMMFFLRRLSGGFVEMG